jgi:hypothetical protein
LDLGEVAMKTKASSLPAKGVWKNTRKGDAIETNL